MNDEQLEAAEAVLEPIEEQLQAEAEPPADEVSEPTEAPAKGKAKKAATEALRPCCIRAAAGDSYLSLAERYAPAGVAARDYAHTIAKHNGNAPVRAGVKIHLP